MGLSSKKQRTTATQTVLPAQQYQPQIDAAASALKPGFEQSQQIVSGLIPKVQGAFDQSQGYYGDVLNGKYLDNNPYIDAVINRSNHDITDAVDSQFSTAGRYGSGYHAGVLTDRLADNENKLRYADYATERGYMNDAASRAPVNAGSLATILASLPQLPSSQYADSISSLLGRYNTSNGTETTKQSGGLLGGLLGAALGGWASGGFKT